MKAVAGLRPVAINVGVRDLEEAIGFYEAVIHAPLELSRARDHARWVFGEGDSFFLSTCAGGMPTSRTATT